MLEGSPTRAEPAPLVQVRDLSVRFGTASPAVDGVSFDIGAGEALGLLGESGCGKTTTGLSLLGLAPPGAKIEGGSVRILGRELLSLSEQAWEKVRGAEIAAIFQEPGLALNPVLCVGDQIAEVIRAHRGFDRSRRRAEAESLLTQVRLSDVRRIYSAYPHELSGGQRQRVLIAQAVACRPALLIADEPTAALDASLEAEILVLLKELQQRLRMALLLVSHSLRTLAAVADRLLVMYAGRIVEEGSLASVYRRPLHPYTRALMRALPQPGGQGARGPRPPSIPGQAPGPFDPRPGCAFEPRCEDRMDECRLRAPRESGPEAARRVRCLKYGG